MSDIKYFTVPTRYGNVRVTPLRDGELHIVSGNVPKWEAEDGEGYILPVTINRVGYQVRGWMRRTEDGAWTKHHELWVVRLVGFNDTSPSAQSKAENGIYRDIAAWLKTPSADGFHAAMRRAQAAELAGEKAKLVAEAEAIAARLAVIADRLEAITAQQEVEAAQ